MGHIRLGALPKTRTWNTVMSLLDDDPANVQAIANATVHAMRSELEKQKNEPGLAYGFWLLTRITWFARGNNFVSDLQEIGIDLQNSDSALSFISAISDHVRKKSAAYEGSTNFREFANLSLKKALSETVAISTPSLFGSSLDNVIEGCKQYSSRKQFGLLSRRYFSSFFSRSLQYFIDKGLANHIGPGHSIATKIFVLYLSGRS